VKQEERRRIIVDCTSGEGKESSERQDWGSGRGSGGGLGESLRERSEEGYLRELVRVRLGGLLDGLNSWVEIFYPAK
jgi:hypothetical protein